MLLGALGFLLLRRLVSPQLRYISLANDYFPLFLLLGIGITGVLLRHFVKTDIEAVKALAMGILSFKPVAPDRRRPAVLHPLLPGLRAVRLLPLQQADAHGGRVHEPDAQPGQQQPRAAGTSTPGTTR